VIARLQDSTERLTSRQDRQEEAAEKLAEQARNLRRRAARLAVGLDAYRNQVDGIPRRTGVQTVRGPFPPATGTTADFPPRTAGRSDTGLRP